jgi:2-keto-4-pentenoate hydratase/2-oxohepta-3-ene-1,7-dioic acid hydratase in catechol pathway
LKLVIYDDRGPRVGAVIGDLVLDVQTAQPFLPGSLEDILRRGLLPSLQNLVDNASEIAKDHLKPLKGLALYPPIMRPSKIICLILNYESHAAEQNREPPKHPVAFSKAPSALSGPFDEIVIRPGVEQVDAEAELAVVIGREGTMIDTSEALDYVAGYMAFNDVSARKIQIEDRQFFRGKSFDTFAPCGPWLVTPDELGDPHELSIIQRLNGEVMQESNTKELIFTVPEIISFLSQGLTLVPGDIIATGTPGGVGLFRDPQLFLKEGDLVEVEIERIGKITNRVRNFASDDIHGAGISSP